MQVEIGNDTLWKSSRLMVLKRQWGYCFYDPVFILPPFNADQRLTPGDSDAWHEISLLCVLQKGYRASNEFGALDVGWVGKVASSATVFDLLQLPRYYVYHLRHNDLLMPLESFSLIHHEANLCPKLQIQYVLQFKEIWWQSIIPTVIAAKEAWSGYRCSWKLLERKNTKSFKLFYLTYLRHRKSEDMDTFKD